MGSDLVPIPSNPYIYIYIYTIGYYIYIYICLSIPSSSPTFTEKYSTSNYITTLSQTKWMYEKSTIVSFISKAAKDETQSQGHCVTAKVSAPLAVFLTPRYSSPNLCRLLQSCWTKLCFRIRPSFVFGLCAKESTRPLFEGIQFSNSVRSTMGCFHSGGRRGRPQIFHPSKQNLRTSERTLVHFCRWVRTW